MCTVLNNNDNVKFRTIYCLRSALADQSALHLWLNIGIPNCDSIICNKLVRRATSTIWGPVSNSASRLERSTLSLGNLRIARESPDTQNRV